MSIYTAPSTSFIDGYINAARYRDEKTSANNDMLRTGVDNLVKSGVESHKFQQRKNILKNKEEIKKRIEALLAEKARLTSGVDYAGSSRNFDAIINGMDWNLMPRVYINEEFEGVI